MLRYQVWPNAEEASHEDCAMKGKSGNKITASYNREKEDQNIILKFGFPVRYVNIDDSCMNHYFPVYDSQCFVYALYAGCALCV